jgi:hypothetical protein
MDRHIQEGLGQVKSGRTALFNLYKFIFDLEAKSLLKHSNPFLGPNST